MTAERRIMLAIAVSPDGTKCAAECPHVRKEEAPDENGAYEFEDAQWFCGAFGGVDLRAESADSDVDWLRDPKCIAAESAAREAEVDALQRGYEHGASTAWLPLGQARENLNAEIERVRRGES